MTTYFHDFAIFERARSNDYAQRRSNLGHNVRRMRGTVESIDKKSGEARQEEVFRVYFSSSPVVLDGAIDVKSVRPR